MSARDADEYARKLASPADAVAGLADGTVLGVAMAIGQPPALLAAIADRVRAGDLRGLVVYYKLAMDPLAETLLADDVLDRIDARSFFISGRDHDIIRRQADADRKILSFVPVHFSQLPRLFEETIALDAFVVTVSPMDASGHFSFGTNNDFATTAARRARRLIVEVNRNMPRVFGDAQLHVSEVDAIVENHVPLLEAGAAVPSEAGRAIGRLVAPLVPNGATIQIGIGKIPAGIVEALAHHEDLGIHTELFSPAMVGLVASGVVTGRRKTLHPRKHVFTVAIGTAETYAFMDDNPSLESYPSSYVNDVRTIARHRDFVSINTAIEIDLYGQVNAEFIGEHEYSGSGGQFDFVKGAALAPGGRSVLALASTARRGTVSTIVPRVSMVTDPRMDVEWVATEHGIVDLRGKSTRERALALVSIADPAFRDELTAAARRVTLI